MNDRTANARAAKEAKKAKKAADAEARLAICRRAKEACVASRRISQLEVGI